MVLLANSENKLGEAIGQFQMILRDSRLNYMRPQPFFFSGHYFKEFELEFLIWGSSLQDDFVIGSTRQDVKKKQFESKSESRRKSF